MEISNTVPEELESNAKLDLAFRLLEYTKCNVFLTGKAGTGKTTFLHSLKKKSTKRMVVVAPTGIAAINAGGITIHSFLQIPFGPYCPSDNVFKKSSNKNQKTHQLTLSKRELIQSIDLMVIDEISMVRADLLDAINDFLQRYRKNYQPFGGVQLLMIGDLNQLSPIVKDSDWDILKFFYETPYFFGSKSVKDSNFISVELDKIYRQTDRRFIEILNKVRDNKLDEETIEILNAHYCADIENIEDCIQLTTHNYQADEINHRKLRELQSKSFFFNAQIKGLFPRNMYPTAEELELKEEAQVMFVKNDSSQMKQYYNGMIGKIVKISQESITVKTNTSTIQINTEEWTNAKYTLDPVTKDIIEEVEGSFTQYPLKLAWAITVHKSQGLTFEKSIIDINESFAHGQVYVAMSRCKSLEGLFLKKPINPLAIKYDSVVKQFVSQIAESEPNEEKLIVLEKEYLFELLIEQFDFYPLKQSLVRLKEFIDKHSINGFEILSATIALRIAFVEEHMVQVGERFVSQIKKLISNSINCKDDPRLQDRVSKGAAYFLSKIDELRTLYASTLAVEIDNKDIEELYEKSCKDFYEQYHLKNNTLPHTVKYFAIKDYLKNRALGIRKENAPSPSYDIMYQYIAHPELAQRFFAYRQKKAIALNTYPSKVIPHKSLLLIAERMPSSLVELKSIEALGKKRIDMYGKDILEIIRVYCQDKNMHYEPTTNSDFLLKRKKGESLMITLALHQQGKNSSQIAELRGMAVSTIIAHITKMIEQGSIKIDELVPIEKQKAILSGLENFETSTALQEHLGEDYSFSEIRWVKAAKIYNDNINA